MTLFLLFTDGAGDMFNIGNCIVECLWSKTGTVTVERKKLWKMLKMSSFFSACQLPRTPKKFHPIQLLKVFFHLGDCEMIMNGEKLNDELIALKFVKLKPDMKKMRPRKKHEMLGCDFCHTF